MAKNQQETTTTPRRLYTRAECGRLFTFYTNRPENEHNDAHPRLIAFAQELGRTPGSVGIQLRVIKRLCTTGKKQRGMSNSGKILREVVATRRNRKAKTI